ncbi:hypothetical protein KOI35_03855 [Actinoplanes bogorensis]|uniref:Lipoprotein n=1 Tax=Paractinoplanes bogorensis TaxID=1610840 RepID=A0ABS5YH04_9ACTN|nr:hypothetical protein [Actinoplanes bogorensis]MBU2662632.1 hypothetical protein [Actinoplanes bogorensis]
MLRLRTVLTALIGASFMTLAACGGDDTTAAWTEPAATTATSAAPAAEPTDAAPADAAPAAADAPTDKAICNAAGKADKAFKAELIQLLQSAQGEPSDADMAKVLGGLGTELEKAAGSSETKVGLAVKKFAAGAAEVANSASPMTEIENPEYEASGKAITAACKTVGVTVNY